MSRIEHAIIFAALLVACANCTSSYAGLWQKVGTSEQMTSRDTAECRGAAQEEALHRYPLLRRLSFAWRHRHSAVIAA